VAIAWQRQGQQDKARESLNEALKAKPDYAPALLELARTSALSGDIEAALVGLDKVPRQSAAGAEALKLRGDLLLYSKRDMAGALAAYQNRCRSIQPTRKGRPQSSNCCWYRARSMTPRRLCRCW
jgi:Tfp pilus assembly protein PilF